MCSCGVWCLSHTVVPLWCEKIAGTVSFFKFCKQKHRQYSQKEKGEAVLPISPLNPNSIKKCPGEHPCFLARS